MPIGLNATRKQTIEELRRMVLSARRARSPMMSFWLHRCNWHRPHGSLGAKLRISRLGLAEDYLLRLHS
jgi:hypothetical protein